MGGELTQWVRTGSAASHLEGLAVFALPSPLPEERLLLVLLLLLLQRPDVLLETNEGVLFVHVCIEVNSIELNQSEFFIVMIHLRTTKIRKCRPSVWTVNDINK